MMKILRFLLGGMLLFIVITVAAFVYLKWWQALLVVLAMIVAIVGGVRFLLRNIGKMMAGSMLKVFDIKSQVLRGAEVQVHRVDPTTPPARDDRAPDDAPIAPGNYYRVDVTITPASSAGPMTHWDLDDLRLVPFDAPARSLQGMAAENVQDIENYCLQNVQVMDGGHFVDDAQGKYQGAQQIRAIVGVPPHVRALKFQYYAEQFGRIELPQPLPQLA